MSPSKWIFAILTMTALLIGAIFAWKPAPTQVDLKATIRPAGRNQNAQVILGFNQPMTIQDLWIYAVKADQSPPPDPSKNGAYSSASQLVWHIQSTTKPYINAQAITYGNIPQNASVVYPTTGKATALKPNQWYAAVAQTSEGQAITWFQARRLR